MKNLPKTIRAWSKIFLLTIFIVFANLTNAAAQKNAAPKFSGALAAQGKAFKAFIIKNVGKRVYLKLTFNEENMPYGYRSEFGDPVFSVNNYAYFLDCDDREANVEWTARCQTLGWSAKNKTLTGFFKVTEPDPKLMRTNRTFHLTPMK